MKKKAINTMFMKDGFQAQLFYDDHGIELIQFYKFAYPVSTYYASTILEIESGHSLMLDDGLSLWVTADQVKAVKEMIMEHVIAKFIEETNDNIHEKIMNELDERGMI